MIMGIRKFMAVWCLLIIPGFSFCQGVDYSQYLKTPNAMPPSPDAASIEKFGNIPVTYCTGVADISIPVWNIKCGNLTWPVSLSYHSGGIRVDEIASSVGLGWALIAPGVITRSVVGLPDEEDTGNPDYSTVSSSDYSYLYDVWHGQKDSEQDIFTFNFNGKSGKFVLNQDGTVFQIPYSTMKIVNNGFSSFSITDDNGVNYFFDQKEYINSDNGSTITNYVCSWYLSKVTLPDQKDSISFTYTPSSLEMFQYYYSFTHAVGSKPTATATLTNFNEVSFVKTNIRTGVLRLSQISFPNGTIGLTYAGSSRSDIACDNQLSSLAVYQQSKTSWRRIKKISFNQSYFYNNPPGLSIDSSQAYRLRLDSLFEYGDTLSNPPQKYTFGYNATPMVPRGTFGQDTWGFNNGHYENVNLIQTQNIIYSGDTYTIGNGNRNPDSVLMLACMLTDIHYPTGGKTVFTYEPHRYITQQTVDSAINQGGTVFGDGVKTLTDTFTYASGASQAVAQVDMTAINYTGVTDRSYVTLTDLTTSTLVINFSQITPTEEFTTSSVLNLTPGHLYQIQAFVYTNTSVPQVRASFIISYTVPTIHPLIKIGGGIRIKEIDNYSSDSTLAASEQYEYDSAITLTPYHNINQTSNTVFYRLGSAGSDEFGGCVYTTSPACLVFNSGSAYPVTTAMGSPLMYRHARKFVTDHSTGATNGKTEYTYEVIQDGSETLSSGYIDIPLISNEWKNGFLTSQAEYKVNDGVYSLVKSETNQYAEYKNANTYSLKVRGLFIQMGCLIMQNQYVSTDMEWVPYPIATGCKKLSQTIDTMYDDFNNKIVTVKNQTYGSSYNDFVTTSSYVDSKGNIDSTTFTYPQDSSVLGNVYYKMVQANKIAPVIQQQSFKGATLLNTLKINYRDWNNDSKVLEPEIIQGSILSNPLENRVQYYAYDSFSNVLSVGKTSDAIHAYIWDYRHTVPIAQVTNTSVSDIAYTSFEADGSGTWSVSSSSRDTTTGITGSNSYVLSSNISRSGLSTGTTYIVSYWTQNGTPYSITGTISGYPVKGKTINGWTFYLHKVTGQSTITISGSGHIDELRLYPSGAQMTTYTYSPLVGMTSQCDVNNRVTYYEYDGFQRLKRIRDQDHNILKTYEYQYQAASGCGANCFIVAMQTFAGSNTLSYPVGVFNANGKLLDTAANQAAYISLWNADTANANRGTLAAGADSMHFQITLNTGKTLPSITGCRYYQYDLAWSRLDAVRNNNAAYVDFGDGTGMKLEKMLVDTPAVLAPYTTYHGGRYNDFIHNNDDGVKAVATAMLYLIHDYPDTANKIITFYHNDEVGICGFDNVNSPAAGLTRLKNFRGNIPQQINEYRVSSFQQSSALSVAQISNWNSIQSIQHFELNNGDGVNVVKNLGYAQDFMQYNKGLQEIEISEASDTTFKISRMKSDWNTYFTGLTRIEINDYQWDREDLSGLKNLWFVKIALTKPGGNSVIDTILNQIAAGAGQNVRIGLINITYPGYVSTMASQPAIDLLKSKLWVISINGVHQ
jgi:hypothetical protein